MSDWGSVMWGHLRSPPEGCQRLYGPRELRSEGAKVAPLRRTVEPHDHAIEGCGYAAALRIGDCDTLGVTISYRSFAYSALACFRMGMSGSASLQMVKKSS